MHALEKQTSNCPIWCSICEHAVAEQVSRIPRFSCETPWSKVTKGTARGFRTLTTPTSCKPSTVRPSGQERYWEARRDGQDILPILTQTILVPLFVCLSVCLFVCSTTRHDLRFQKTTWQLVDRWRKRLITHPHTVLFPRWVFSLRQQCLARNLFRHVRKARLW